MNKIFKVIWNRTTQSLVVTSELAKGVAKASSEVNVESKSSLGKVFKLSALSLLLLDVTSTVYAASSAPAGAGDGKSEAIALGARSSAAPGAVVIGAGSIATGNIKGVAIGHTVLANGQDAVAIGSNSQSVTQGVALGRLANAGNSATALGNQATASGEKSVAAGNQATASGGSSIALGNSANAKNTDDVALGSGSVTGARNALTSITINGNEVGNNGQESGTSVLAVGNSTSARQVQYVSAGLISATSTDAINGSQLYCNNGKDYSKQCIGVS